MHENIEKWLMYKRHNEGRSDNTIIKYRLHLVRLYDWLDEQGIEITGANTDQLLTFTGTEAFKSNISHRSRKPMVAAIKGFYAWMMDQGIINSDPAKSVPYPKSGRVLPVPMRLESAEKLMAEPDMETLLGVRDIAIMSIIIGCGLRVTPITNLNESSLTFFDMDGIEHLIIRTREKGDKERLVPAPHETKLLIRAYLGHPDLSEIDRTLPDGDKLLFVTTNNTTIPKHEYHGETRRMGRKAINKMIKKYGERARVDTRELHPHAGRHLFGTELAEDDVDILLRKQLMGHENESSTEIYEHLAERKKIETILKSSPITKINTPVTGMSRLIHKSKN